MSWWTSGGATGAVAVYQPIGAASLAASYTDLSGSGNNAAPGVAPSFDTATGWGFDGATQYLTTGVTPIFGGTMLVRFSGASTTRHQSIAGCFGPSYLPGFTLSNSVNGNTQREYDYGDTYTKTGSPISGGVLCIAGSSGYLDGVFDVALSSTGGAPSAPVFVGCYRNPSGSPEDFSIATIEALAIYNTTLDATMVAAVSAAMAALPTVAATDSPLPPLFAPNLAMRAY